MKKKTNSKIPSTSFNPKQKKGIPTEQIQPALKHTSELNTTTATTTTSHPSSQIVHSKPKTQKQPTLDFFGIKTPKANNESLFPSLPTNTPFSLYSWNINGIRSVISRGDLQEFIKQASPDILCLNETKIDQITLNKERIEYLFNKTYLTYWTFSQVKKGYSGVAIFTKYKPVSVSYGVNIKEYDLEGRVITIEYEVIVIIAVYVPNSGKERFEYRTKEWDVVFRKYVSNVKSKFNNKHVIVIGDMNVAHKDIDVIDPQEHMNVPPCTAEERNNFEELLNVGFVDSFRFIKGNNANEYTWYGVDKERKLQLGFRIDYCLVDTNISTNITKANICKEYIGSDHVPIMIELSI